MVLTKYREAYKPFEYPMAYEFMKLQQNAHWLPSEVAMSKDVTDWNSRLAESERAVIGEILKSFVQSETHVNEYWSSRVAKWFPKHEVRDMAVTFAAMEAVHTEGYAYLNDTLGLDDYKAFLEDPTAVAKLDALKACRGNSKRDIARSLAVFSAFTEGVNLFSSFAILMNFSRFNLLDGVETIVSWSVRDESLHSLAGCWLFRQFISENQHIWDDELKKDIYEAARLSVKLEDDYIDHAFAKGQIRGLDPKDLKNFIRHRANTKLQDLGLKSNWKNIDKEALERMSWFDDASGGRAFTDFFAKRVTDYAKCDFTIDNLFDDGKTEAPPVIEFTEEELAEKMLEIEKVFVDYQKELDEHKKNGEAPEWMTKAGYQTLSKGYRLKGETPKGMYRRVANGAAKRLYEFGLFKLDSKEMIEYSGNAAEALEETLGMTERQLSNKFYNAMWKNWLCPASPVLANTGTDRGLPISCFGVDIGDSVEEISLGIGEGSSLSKEGGGVGFGIHRVRPKGSPIKGGANGHSEGIIPFMKMYDSMILAMNQGSNRRGAASMNYPVDGGDWAEFIRMRRPEGDINRQCQNLHHCTTLDDNFLDRIDEGKREAREKWTELMKARMETGESYIMNLDRVNENNPPGYKKLGLEVSMTNICSEITLFTDSMHSFICCLASANLVRYDEWKDEELGFLMCLFLNGILNEFISKARDKFAMEKVVRHAIRGRAIGIGVLGWHSLLQSKMLPFDSFNTMMLNNEIFKNLRESAEAGTTALANALGNPEWCIEGRFNSHLLALAPTRSNSIISGDTSPSIEPFIGNAYIEKAAKGTFIRRNPYLEKVLEAHGKNTEKIWKDISRQHGSVQHLKFLTEDEKKVFRTAYEIDQFAIIRQAEQRLKYVCQAQSTNLFFSKDVDPVYFSKVHLEGARKLKTLYYCRSESNIQADHASRGDEGACESCEG